MVAAIATSTAKDVNEERKKQQPALGGFGLGFTKLLIVFFNGF